MSFQLPVSIVVSMFFYISARDTLLGSVGEVGPFQKGGKVDMNAYIHTPLVSSYF